VQERLIQDGTLDEETLLLQDVDLKRDIKREDSNALNRLEPNASVLTGSPSSEQETKDRKQCAEQMIANNDESSDRLCAKP
jgi:hypothetical protein